VTILRNSSLLLALLLVGCRTVYVTEPLPLPPQPLIPTIPAGSLMCLSDEAYEALVVRDVVLKGYADQLRAIIEAHNEQAQ
jgi:hypothetical protein